MYLAYTQPTDVMQSHFWYRGKTSLCGFQFNIQIEINKLVQSKKMQSSISKRPQYMQKLLFI